MLFSLCQHGHMVRLPGRQTPLEVAEAVFRVEKVGVLQAFHKKFMQQDLERYFMAQTTEDNKRLFPQDIRCRLEVLLQILWYSTAMYTVQQKLCT